MRSWSWKQWIKSVQSLKKDNKFLIIPKKNATDEFLILRFLIDITKVFDRNYDIINNI